MTTDTKNQLIQQIKTRKYLNKDFASFKRDLFEYARVHFPDKIRDLSEPSLAGMFLEFAAYVGDVQSFYLDHQFHELDPNLAVEPRNIERHLSNAGVEVVGSSPSVVSITISLEVPADTNENPPIPMFVALPVIHAGTTFPSNVGTSFELTEDVDFAETRDSAYIASIKISARDANNNPTAFIMSRKAIAISGKRQVESFSVGSFEAFKKFSLSKENVTEIVSVSDSQGNTYYQVEYLTQDTVYQALINRNDDGELVKENLAIIPAPYRFVKKTDLQTRLTSLIFGGGGAATLDDDIIPDPSEFAVPLYGKRNFSRFTLNPGNLLQTTTLGVITPNSTITVEYRHGGGLKHNVNSGGIRGIQTLVVTFPNGPSNSIASFVRRTIDAINEQDAQGGDDAPTSDDLRAKIPALRASQSRIVTKEDLLARIYTMPSNFGRVFRASVRANTNNPLATQLFIISRNNQGQLAVSPDSLKKNLQTYLNGFRMISDAIDILDAQVVNFKVEFSVVIDPSKNKKLVLQNIVSRLNKYFSIKYFEIDQPIILSDLQNLIYNNPGVISVTRVVVLNLSGPIGGRQYSDVQFDVEANTTKGIIIGPPGSIFEMRNKLYDVEGTAI